MSICGKRLAASGWINHSRVTGLGCRYGHRIGFGYQARDQHPNPNTGTRLLMAETWDLQ